MFNYSDSECLTDVKIKSPMGPRDEIIFLGDLECSCNMVSSIWSVERKTYRSICDI